MNILGSKKCTQTMKDDPDESSVMVHAAKIMAEVGCCSRCARTAFSVFYPSHGPAFISIQYIDGNRDGEPDNAAVAAALGESQSATTITMFGSQHDPAMIRQRFPALPKRHYHDLECDETPEGGECSGEPQECFDNAHCELVQVLITYLLRFARRKEWLFLIPLAPTQMPSKNLSLRAYCCQLEVSQRG